jgi:hypothetical protein
MLITQQKVLQQNIKLQLTQHIECYININKWLHSFMLTNNLQATNTIVADKLPRCMATKVLHCTYIYSHMYGISTTYLIFNL